MAARPSDVKICGVLNIIAGCAYGLGGLFLTAMAVGFGGSGIEVTAMKALIVAGVLFAISGVWLLLSSVHTRNGPLRLLVLAVVFTLPFNFMMLFEEGLPDPRDDLMVLFFWLPGLVALLALYEVFYLWQRGSAK